MACWRQWPGMSAEPTIDPGGVGAVTVRLIGRLGGVSPWTWLALLLVVVHASWMSWMQVDMHLGLGTFAYDAGLYDQGVWLLSRGESPFVTLMGRNLLGDHASLILFFLVPLYWIVPGTATLLVSQAVAIALGALPFYFYARHRLGHGAFGVLAAIAWLANPAVNGTNMENFHPDGYLGLLVPLAMFAALERRWRMYVVAIVFVLLVKEDTVLLIAPLGLWVALRRDSRRGWVTVAASVAAALAGMFLLMRPLIGVPTRNAWRIPFGGPWGLIRTTFTDPGALVEHLRSEDRPLYLWQMAAPFAGLFVLSPWVAAIAVPVVASNTLSTFWYQHNIQYHYSLVAVPPLLFAVIHGARRFRENTRAVVLGIVVVTSLLTSHLWGQHTLAAEPRLVWSGDNPVARSAREIIRTVPDDAVISVYDPLVTHLAHRPEVYFFPNPFRALYYGVGTELEGSRLPAADGVEYVVLPRFLNETLSADWARERAAFVEATSNDHWIVYVRRRPAIDPASGGAP